MNYWDCASQLSAALERPESDGMAYHIPVLPQEIQHVLQPGPGRLMLDGTLGGGGHTRILLEAGSDVIALDQDADAIAEATRALSGYGNRLRIVRSNFRQAARALDAAGIQSVDGALLDLGVSSHQLDEAERGFSFMRNGPLDMRMDRRSGTSAADIVNTASFEELIRIFRDYGEEPRAARIASRIINVREKKSFETTNDLVAAVESVARRTGPKQPATRVFQALRIAVNDELTALEEGLEAIAARLAPGACLAVISFHSLEDRIVKQTFRRRSQVWIDRPEWPAPRRNPDQCFELITNSPMVATPEETEANPRARSAKLRAVRKICPTQNHE